VRAAVLIEPENVTTTLPAVSVNITLAAALATLPAAKSPLINKKTAKKRFTRTPAEKIAKNTYVIIPTQRIKFLLNSSATELTHDFQHPPTA